MSAPRNWVVGTPDPAWHAAAPDPGARRFHATLADYEPTPLVALPALAAELGVGQVFAKDESHRLGLPAFKGLGASWAVRRTLVRHAGQGPLTVVTATDGNHGRAVARFAVQWGHRATVFVPVGVHPAAVAAIRDEGATVVEVDGTYDEAVAAAARLGEQAEHALVQDTAWDGYEEIPGWIVDGYDTLFAELDDQLAARGVPAPGLVAVPTGVGSLLQAALVHYRRPGRAARVAVVAIEPEDAACVRASLAAGRPVSVPTGTTVMAGLNCGTVSSLAWPVIAAGLDAALTSDDDAALAAAARLAELGVDAGPCGAAPLAALRTALTGPGGDALRHRLGLSEASTVVLLVTEGTAANPATA